MKDEPRKPLEALGDEVLEARIVAWVLGEASAFEAAELEARCAKEPEWKLFADRMRELHRLIGEDGKPVADEDWKLPEAKRRKVIDLLGVEPAVSARKARSPMKKQLIVAMAACVLATLIALPVFYPRGEFKLESASVVSYMKESAPADYGFSARSEAPASLDESRRPYPSAGTPAPSVLGFSDESVVLESRQLAEGEQRNRTRDASLEVESLARGSQLAQNGEAGRRFHPATISQGAKASPAPIERPAVTESKPQAPEALAYSFYSPADDEALVNKDAESTNSTRLNESAGVTLTDGLDRPSRFGMPLDSIASETSSEVSEELEDAASLGDLSAGQAIEIENPLIPSLGFASDLQNDYRLGGELHRVGERELDSTPLDAFFSGDGLNQSDESWGKDSYGDDVRMAEQSLAKEDETIRSNSASLGEVDKDLGELRRGLYEAEGAYQLGKYDQAKERYENVLRRDPSNLAARRGLERASAADSDYYRAGYDQARAELLMEVDEAWELAVPPDASSFESKNAPGIAGELDELDSLAAAEGRLRELQEKQASGSSGRTSAHGNDRWAFDDAKSEFETGQRLLEQLKVKLVGEEMQRRISENPVIVHAEPEGNAKKPGLFSFDRRWEAKTVLQVRPSTPSMEVSSGVVSRTDGAPSPSFFPTEFEVVKARETLDKAIDEMNLTARWGVSREEARKALGEMIDVEQIKGTDLFEIRAKAKDAGEAELIAEKVSEAYQKRRAELEGERTTQALAELRDAVKKQEESVEEKRKLLTALIRNQSLVYQGIGEGGRQAGFSAEDSAEMAASSFAELSENKILLDSQIETLQKFDDEQLMTYAAGLELPENGIKALHPRYLEAKRMLDTLKLEGLAGDHPKVEQQEAIVEKMRRDLDSGVVELRETLVAQRELAVQQLSKLTDQMAGGVIDANQLPDIEKRPEMNQNKVLDAMAEISAADEPFSTFSLHVSDASFKLAAAAMERGEVPAAESVRPEEFYNAFDYGDPAPTADEPVACAIEQCAHPVFPQRNLLRIAVRTGAEGRAESTPLNLTLLLDNSGSMEREDRANGVSQAVAGLASLLKEGDTVTVAGFSRQPRLLGDRIDGKDAATLNGLVDQTPAEGGTNLEEALILGGDLAKRQYQEGAQNRVVLFTDGAANLGDADPETLNQKIELLRNEGIAFDAAGFGADGLNDRLLERLTRNGNGRYHIVNDAEDADEGFANKLAGAFRPAAENVKVQVVFNPARVGNYKLIGFDEHRLKKEDFRDDAVDAAEMAAEEAGVALYQFEVLPDGQGEVGEVSVRFRDTSTGEMVERSWSIPYDPQAPSFDRAKPGLQLAGIAALVAEKLRGAPLSEAVDYSELRPVMGRVKAEYAGNERVAQLERMMRR
ncbi:YfbK domain-containing protein [Haloferula sp.]|uniref:YfbK domain-containing protein n=1 Tax=Haloferula sp. TaxID=2497595 RepID=UPI003C77EE43